MTSVLHNRLKGANDRFEFLKKLIFGITMGWSLRKIYDSIKKDPNINYKVKFSTFLDHFHDYFSKFDEALELFADPIKNELLSQGYTEDEIYDAYPLWNYTFF